MRIFFFAVIIYFWSSSVSAKPSVMDCDSLQQLVVEVMKLKHLYEASLMLQSDKWRQSREQYERKKDAISRSLLCDTLDLESPDSTLAAYKVTIARIKEHGNDFPNCLVNEYNKSKQTTATHHEQFYYRNTFFYDFKNPYSSQLLKENIISYTDCLRIFKHFLLDEDRDVLPPLTEALDFLRVETPPRPVFNR